MQNQKRASGRMSVFLWLSKMGRSAQLFFFQMVYFVLLIVANDSQIRIIHSVSICYLSNKEDIL
ncbi:MAG TPA: hypothetical protein DEP00_01780 [Lachnospiraceae bacterium]|nr:hypothetical protein [Lachnospiraceae bacterium]